jgi:hypothetical protein
MTALSYLQRIKTRGISLARFITRGLMFIVQTTRGRCLTARGCCHNFWPECWVNLPYRSSYAIRKKLAELPQVEKSKYLQSVLGRRR